MDCHSKQCPGTPRATAAQERCARLHPFPILKRPIRDRKTNTVIRLRSTSDNFRDNTEIFKDRGTFSLSLADEVENCILDWMLSMRIYRRLTKIDLLRNIICACQHVIRSMWAMY